MSSDRRSARGAIGGAGLAGAVATALLCVADAAPAQDRHLPASQAAFTMERVRYSFKEHFTYSLRPDSLKYGTLDQFRRLYPESYWKNQIKNMTNEDGSLAWRVSQDMMALVTLYDVTKDASYLDWLSQYADAVIAGRDDKTKKRDEEGRSDPGWSTPRYGSGARRIYLVHSSLIIEPILEWALRADKAPGWSAQDEARRKRLINECIITMKYHDYQLVGDASPGEMVYASGREEIDRKFTWQPFNRQNQMGRNYYLLYRLTADESYKKKSEMLYRFFKNRIERTASDAYVWEYEPIQGVGSIRVDVCDDVSHASYALSPVVAACKDGFVFDRSDLARFARTFTHYIHLGDGVFQSKIGCEPAFTPRYMERLFAWLPVSEADPQVYRLLRRFLLGNVERPQPLAIAYLIAYKPKAAPGVDTRAR